MLKLRVWGRSVLKVVRPQNDNREVISLFDVKELYDAAYAEKDKARGNLKEFTRLLARAAKLEEAYREQEAMAEMNKFRARAHKAAKIRIKESTGGRHG